jgi:hypothetical protein
MSAARPSSFIQKPWMKMGARHASGDEPKYEIKGDKTDRIAIRKYAH